MGKKIDLQQEDIKHLLQLIKENPELEIMPMVNSEIVASDDWGFWGFWAGSWGKATIDEYWVDDERIYFRDEDEDDLIENEVDNIGDQYEEPMPYEELEKIAKASIEKYDWKRVIVVRINMP